MDPEFLLLVASFFVIATVYSSAGFGGGSSYLAVLSVALHEYSQMRTIALVCNLVVVLGSVWLFWKAGQWSWRLAAPLLALSVPMAYLGASLSLNPEAFFGLLGGALIAAAVAMVVQEQRLAHVTDRSPGRSGAIANVSIGGLIGFLSGLVGIGGGIFLSPILHLVGWETARRIAAVSSLFILVNSLAGIAGLLFAGHLNFGQPRMLMLPFAVLVGGQFGTRFCLSERAARHIGRVTAALVLIAGVRILAKAVLS